MNRIFIRTILSTGILGSLAALNSYGQCKDPWVSQAVHEVKGSVNGSGNAGDCNIYNYGGGHWSSYPDLKSKVEAHFRTAAPQPAAQPVLSQQPAQGNRYRLITANNKCLGVEGGNGAAGARLIEWDCINVPDQIFTFMTDGTIRTFNGLCVDERSGMGRQMDQIETWSCNGTRGQQFRLENYALRSGFTGMCVDIRGGFYAGNRDAILFPCSGQANQRYRWGRDMTTRGGEPAVVTGGGQVPNGGLLMPKSGNVSGGQVGANVIAAGGANVIAAGGANVIAAGGANVIAVGGANVIAAGGAN